jgi:hypothetical protein
MKPDQTKTPAASGADGLRGNAMLSQSYHVLRRIASPALAHRG